MAVKPLIAHIGATAVGSQAAEVNALPVLVAREQQCRAERGRIPNLVAVNWADVGRCSRPSTTSTESERPVGAAPYTSPMTRPLAPQMMHSYHATYDRAENPPPGRSHADLNEHIASHLAAGWTMAFYSTNATATGTVHHFIWRGPELATT